MASMVWTADRRTLVELMSAASLDFAASTEARADAGGGAARWEAGCARDGRSGARPRRTADQTAVRGDLRVGCALHGPSELAPTGSSGTRPRHHHGPRVHRRGGGPRAGLLGRLPGRHARHQHADHDPARPGAAGHRTPPGRARGVRRADGGVGGDVAEGARRRPERRGRPGGRFCGGGVLRSLFGHQPGELPLVIGAGAIGLSTVAALAARGVSPIVVSDYSDDRLAYAKNFGADVLVNPSPTSTRTTYGGRRSGATGFRQRRSSSNASARTACCRASSTRASSWRVCTPRAAGTTRARSTAPLPRTRG